MAGLGKKTNMKDILAIINYILGIIMMMLGTTFDSIPLTIFGATIAIIQILIAGIDKLSKN